MFSNVVTALWLNCLEGDQSMETMQSQKQVAKSVVTNLGKVSVPFMTSQMDDSKDCVFSNTLAKNKTKLWSTGNQFHVFMGAG